MDNLTNNEMNRLQSQYGTSALEATTADLLLDPVVEGFKASPAAQLYDYVASDAWQEGNMNASEANKMYNLEGTPAAFKEGEMVNQNHAKYVANRFMDTQISNARREEVSNQYGAVKSTVTGFLGNLAGGMLDPINLGLGFGGNMAMRKLGMYTAESIAKTASVSLSKQAVQQHVRQTFVEAGIENLAVNTATEYTFGKLQEYATNMEVSTKDRVFGILAGTVLGAGIQAGMTGRSLSKMVKHEEIKASKLNESYGTAAEEIIDKTQQHALNAEANNIKQNPEFVKQKIEAELYDTRSWQTPYEHIELDDFSIGGTKFYKANATGKVPHLDMYTNEFGVGFSDNFNHVHNSVSRSDVEVNSKLRVDHFDMSKASIMDNANFVAHKSEMFSRFRMKSAGLMEQELTGATYNKSKKALSSRVGGWLDNYAEKNKVNTKKINNLKTDLVSAVEGSENITQFKEAMEKFAYAREEWGIDGDVMIKELFQEMRFEGVTLGTKVRNVDDIFNNALEAADNFGEFRDFVKTMFAESDHDVNVDIMLRESLHEMGFDGVHMVANSGEPNAHNMVYMFEPSLAKAKRLERGKITPLDMQKEMQLGEKLKKLELDEMDRFQDHTQDVDYIADYEVDADKIIADTIDEDAILTAKIQDDLEALGITDREATVKTEGDVQAKQLDEVAGMKEALKANEDKTIIEDMTACIVKGKK